MLRRSKGRKTAEDGHQIQRSRILAAGDNPESVELLARLLEREGHEVNRSASTDDALSALILHAYVAAVMEFSGRTTATALLDAIRNHEQAQVSETRVVIIAEDARNQSLTWEAGADGYLVKPFHSNDFLAEVRAAVERPDAERAAHRQARLSPPESADEG